MVVRSLASGALLLLLAGSLLACSSGSPAGSPASATGLPAPGASTDPTDDALARVTERGTLVLSTDIEYPPQSYLVEGAERAADTACAPNQLTATEVEGFDADTGKAVAAALGVEPCFVSVAWNVIIGGGWADRWDISWGSGALSDDRMTHLYVTQPYYALPNHFFVRADSSYQAPGDLDGLEIGACAGCTHELYLKGELDLPGAEIELTVSDPEIVVYDAEPAGLADLAAGGIDAFLSAESVGLAAIESGLPLRELPQAAFFEQETGYLDRSSTLDQASLVGRVNEIIAALHADGTLAALSRRYFGVDYTSEASAFDLDSIGQAVP